MPKYISIEAIRWALDQLKDSCDRTFVDLLIIKREGLTPATPIIINTKNTEPSAQKLMGIVRSDASAVDSKQPFFNPFVRKWLRAGYPRFGTYTTLERVTFRPIVNTDHTPDGMHVSFSGQYLEMVQEKLRRSKDKPLQVPLEALAAWANRYDQMSDSTTVDDAVSALITEYNLTADELSSFFTRANDIPDEFFSNQPVDRDALVTYLVEIAPLDAKPDGGDEPESVIEDLPENLIEYLRGDLLLPEALLRQLVTLLRAGKHLILTGPPGTGKSTLAARLAEVGERYSKEFSFPASSGHVFTTATADWTTFDTLGGYMPSLNGTLRFEEGLFLQALRENKWLVVDELNRADVDKAFGQLFTVLSGHNVVLPFKNGSDQNFSIAFDRSAATSGYSAAEARYAAGQDWRIIATMNTFDRNLLFQISAAFVRRFAVVHVGIPDRDELLEWIEARGLSGREMELIGALMELLYEARPLGPAIWDDMVQYMGMRTKHSFGAGNAEDSAEASFVDAVTAYVLPQLDGLNQEDLGRVERVLLELLKSDPERLRLQRSFKEVF